MKLYRLDHVALWVTDLDRSLVFYTEVIGLEKILELSVYPNKGGPFRDVRLHVGGIEGTGVHLFQSPFAAYQVTNSPVAHPTIDKSAICVDHFGFRVDTEFFERAKRNLEEQGYRLRYLEFKSERPGFQPSRSIQFSDPDGYVFEFQCYDK